MAFEINKAFNISQAIVEGAKATMSAFSWGMSVGGPVLAGSLAAVTAGVAATQVSAISSTSFAGKATGGDVFKNSAFQVNENGPEMLSMGGKDFLMTGNKGGHITPADQLPMMGNGGGSKSNVIINMVHLPGQTADVKETNLGNDTKQIEIIMRKLDSSIAAGISSGTSKTSRSMENTFNLNRGISARI